MARVVFDGKSINKGAHKIMDCAVDYLEVRRQVRSVPMPEMPAASVARVKAAIARSEANLTPVHMGLYDVSRDLRRRTANFDPDIGDIGTKLKIINGIESTANFLVLDDLRAIRDSEDHAWWETAISVASLVPLPIGKGVKAVSLLRKGGQAKRVPMGGVDDARRGVANLGQRRPAGIVQPQDIARREMRFERRQAERILRKEGLSRAQIRDVMSGFGPGSRVRVLDKDMDVVRRHNSIPGDAALQERVRRGPWVTNRPYASADEARRGLALPGAPWLGGGANAAAMRAHILNLDLDPAAKKKLLAEVGDIFPATAGAHPSTGALESILTIKAGSPIIEGPVAPLWGQAGGGWQAYVANQRYYK